MRLFSDREIIKLPGGPVGQALISRMIVKKRLKEVEENYRKIGGGSPIVFWSTRQGEGMVARLRARGHDVEYALAMRYWNPDSAAALDRLEAVGVDRLLALTMYPHYSTATTGSSLAELKRVMAKRRTRLPFDVIDRWFLHEGYIEALAKRTRVALESFPAGDKPTLLISAHGLPNHFIEAGDPYCAHILATMEALLKRIPPHASVLGYQSRVGPVEWIGPSTEEVINRLAAQGVKDVLVIPISFVSDHIETLYEVDMLYADQAKSRGIVNFRRIDSLNDFPPFLDALADLVEPKLG
jgi:protoporphyrin/coproporphyrin ferrochelatase